MSQEYQQNRDKEAFAVERVNFRNSRNLNLVGDLYHVESKLVIVMSHGLTGNRWEHGRFDKTAEALNKENYNVFRFDFSGHGESDDDSVTEGKLIDDLSSALQFISTRQLTEVGFSGLSFGALASLRVWDERIKTMVLWALVTKAKSNPESYYGPEKVKELEETGVLTRVRDDPIRQKVVIDRQLFEDWRGVNQQELLSRIKIPILIIHGDQDATIPIEDSKKGMRYLPLESRLEIVKGADHDFAAQVDTFIEFTVDWFKNHLKE